MSIVPAIVTPTVAGSNAVLNITTTTLVKATGGTVRMVAVNTAGTAPGAIYDTDSIGGVAAGTLAFSIPEAVTAGPQDWKWRCVNGIVAVPPTGGVLALTFD